MDKITKITFALLLSIASSLFMASCSSDDEPDATLQMTGKEKAEFIKSQVLDNDGNIGYYKSDNGTNVYVSPVQSEEIAIGVAKTLSCHDSWDGTTQTVDLGEGYGTIRLSLGEKEGVFTTIVFNVKNIPFFTLELATQEYCQNENMAVSQVIGFPDRFKCTNCNKIFDHVPENNTCPKCGGHSFKKI